LQTHHDLTVCPSCGESRAGKDRYRILFSQTELAVIERVLADGCFPCWKYSNVIGLQELEERAAVRQANVDSRQQLRELAKEVAGGRKGLWFEEVKCHHCQEDATMVVVGNGGIKPSQVKVLCRQCKSHWL
jgi:hypothetical protein